MSATRVVATVFGGSGFIGRYVVKRLAQTGHVVRVAGHNVEAARALAPMGAVGQIVPLYASMADPSAIARAVDGAAFVINLVGILAERRPGDFRRVQAEGPGHVAREAARSGVRRLVHVSAIGADPASPSAYASTKGLGERAVTVTFPSAVVLRPSIVFGQEDNFFNRFAGMAQWLPFLPVIAGDTKFQPVYVGDVADAVIAGLTRDDVEGRLFELGGPRVWSFRELLQWINEETKRHRRLIEIPMRIAQLQADVLQRLPGKLLTRDQLLLLSRDNLVAPGTPSLADLGITPTPVELVVPHYLQRFRPGGGRQDRYAE